MSWSEATLARAEELIGRYPDRRSAVMPLLYLAMAEEGHLTPDGMRRVSEYTGMTPVQVEAVASFYTMYKGHVGKHLVSVCHSISCHLLGADAVLDAACDEAGAPPGETSKDGSVTIEAAECIGACGGAPAVQVDYEMVEGLTPEKIRELVRWLKQEKPDTVNGDDLQQRFGGHRSFEWGPDEKRVAVGPFPAFGPYGTTGEGS